MDEKIFLLASYSGRIAGSPDTFEEAKNKLIILNSGQMIPKLEAALSQMKEGQAVEIPLAPREAFGEKDPGLIRIVPESIFISQNIRPIPGQILTLNDAYAKIKSVSSGRVMADFNHPLSGEYLTYNLKLEKILSQKKEKIEALARDIGMDAEATEEGEKIYLKVKNSSKVKSYKEAKSVLEAVIKGFFPEIKTVEFSE